MTPVQEWLSVASKVILTMSEYFDVDGTLKLFCYFLKDSGQLNIQIIRLHNISAVM
jgi:hypothetical protein